MARAIRLKSGGSTSQPVNEQWDELNKALLDINKRIARIKTTLVQPLGRVIHRTVMERFNSGGIALGDNSSDQWAALKPSTIAIRHTAGQWPGAGGSQPILRRSKRLQRSMQVFPGTSRTILTYGTRLRYASLHEFGGILGEDRFIDSVDLTTGKIKKRKIPKGTIIPARPALNVNDLMIDELEDIILDYTMQRFDRLGEVGEQIVGQFGR